MSCFTLVFLKLEVSWQYSLPYPAYSLLERLSALVACLYVCACVWLCCVQHRLVHRICACVQSKHCGVARSAIDMCDPQGSSHTASFARTYMPSTCH